MRIDWDRVTKQQVQQFKPIYEEVKHAWLDNLHCYKRPGAVQSTRQELEDLQQAWAEDEAKHDSEKKRDRRQIEELDDELIKVNGELVQQQRQNTKL